MPDLHTQLGDRHRDTVLAALRLWQALVVSQCKDAGLADWERRTPLFDFDPSPAGVEASRLVVGIAFENGAPLSMAEIDALCERLNAGLEATETDATVANHGTVCILTPLTDAAKVWCWDHLDEVPRWAGGVLVEPRFLRAITDGMAEAGLSVQRA